MGNPGTDFATRPLGHNELESLDLFHEARGGAEAVEKQHRQGAIFEAVRAAHAAWKRRPGGDKEASGLLRLAAAGELPGAADDA